MAPIRTSWTRLIRFVAAETSCVHIGEPVDANLDIGLAYNERRTIEAREIVGSALDPSSQVSNSILTVKELLAPLERDEVKLVRCLGLNYSDHAAEANMAKPAAPVLFYKPKTTLIGPEAIITVPKAAQPVNKHLPDYEVELTVVIGKPAKDVSEKDALDYVLGYVAGNDTSFRFHQLSVSQWGFSKALVHNSTPIGPVLVAAKAIPDPQVLPLKTFVNGEKLQDGSTACGVGFVKKPPIFLKHGDDVRVWIGAGMGTLINTVVEEGKGKSGLQVKL
ncbi:fumarylacetoacetate hydrolase [Phellopilus nigrolimitatus]|nr:fumarylacetoacetate hydrolase [Phellopilus nigrolimitatus]